MKTDLVLLLEVKSITVWRWALPPVTEVKIHGCYTITLYVSGLVVAINPDLNGYLYKITSPQVCDLINIFCLLEEIHPTPKHSACLLCLRCGASLDI
ncbi:MAG: hypothetical protein F6K10_21385 [Moorea sp. SIO2B7]|nr:hypothetical protein [Moorena sp. SIO2B7]